MLWILVLLVQSPARHRHQRLSVSFFRFQCLRNCCVLTDLCSNGLVDTGPVETT
ncbi:unnamed protein product [Arabidopsis halleri]